MSLPKSAGMSSGAASVQADRPPLFRPEALAQRDAGEPFAFAAPGWSAVGVLALAGAAALFVFSIFATFDRVAYVPGVVIPESGLARLDAPQHGIVTTVLAKQGVRVRKGQPILRIASTAALPNGVTASAHSLDAYRREQQLTEGAMRAEQERRSAERARLADQVQRLAADLDSLSQQLAIQRERIAKNDEWLQRLQPLLAKGYVSNFSYRQQEETGLTMRQQLAALAQRRSEAQHDQAQARLDLAALAAQGSSNALRSEAQMMELERGMSATQAEAESTLVAPIDGVVAAVNVQPGETVAASEEVAALIRTDDPMKVLLYVPSRAAGGLRRGQKVRIRYDAFPYQRYGLGTGVIDSISSAATRRPNAPVGEEPAYRVTARLLKGGPAGQDRLRPDMRLTASILVEKRSLFDWLFAPLREKWREGAD